MKLPFDEIYLLNLVERSDKYIKMREKINLLKWDVKDFRVVQHPISNKIIKMLGPNLYNKGISIINGGVFNCTREHYTIIKQAYLKGLNSVAIIEDDVSFYNDFNLWELYMNNIPQDWDILRIGSLRSIAERQYCDNTSDLWVLQENVLWGTQFYALNRKGMKYIIDFIDIVYTPIDLPLAYYRSDINVYIPNKELCICIEDSYISDIRGDISNDPISKYIDSITNLNKKDYI